MQASCTELTLSIRPDFILCFSFLGSPFETGPQHFINHKCLYWPPKPTTDTPGFPSNPETCTGGLRAEVTFPSCWDGLNLDSADHKSHMAYPGPDGFWESGRDLYIEKIRNYTKTKIIKW